MKKFRTTWNRPGTGTRTWGSRSPTKEGRVRLGKLWETGGGEGGQQTSREGKKRGGRGIGRQITKRKEDFVLNMSKIYTTKVVITTIQQKKKKEYRGSSQDLGINFSSQQVSQRWSQTVSETSRI